MKRLLPVLLALLSTVLTARAASNDAARPNVILIVGDDLGYADVGCQQLSKDVRTPNLDALAAGGVRFTNGYVSCPVCSPTRAGLMTGRYQQRFGHEFNPGAARRDDFGLPLEQKTIAAVLMDAGYHTGMVGKWHLGDAPQYQPPKRGFDEFFGFLGGAHSYVEHRDTILRGEEVVPETEYLTDAFAREAVAFIDKNHDKPFFLYLPFNAIHTPLDKTPEKYLKGLESVEDPKRKTMLAMLSAMDSGIGQVIQALARHGIDGEKTLIIFFTDNGGPTNANTSRNTPLSGFKGGVREGGIRTPAIMRWDKHIPAGKVEDAPVMQIDYFPTIASAAGAGDAITELKLDGVDLLPYLSGKSADKPHQTLFWRYGSQFAVRDGDLKLFDENKGDGPQLIDLSSDIAEAKNLWSSRPDDVKRLQALYDAWNQDNIAPLWESRRANAANRRNRATRPANAVEQ